VEGPNLLDFRQRWSTYDKEASPVMLVVLRTSRPVSMHATDTATAADAAQAKRRVGWLLIWWRSPTHKGGAYLART
jgi:hypothetical protein